jgi:hypothetical protein
MRPSAAAPSPVSSPVRSITSVPFIRYGGNFIPRQPYGIRGVTGYGFAANGDLSKIQALCDKTLSFGNAAPYYKVISPTVLFTFIKMDRLSSADPVDVNKGSKALTARRNSI